MNNSDYSPATFTVTSSRSDTSGAIQGLATHSGKKAIVFIDSSVKGAEALIAQLGQGVEVFVLNDQMDGIAQIADRLEGRSCVEAVHIVSHGGPASIQLGSSELSSSTLSSYEFLLYRIGSALSNEADILLYGCEVASGPEGRAFVEDLARLTGADVAASDDPTGSSILGGDVNLEGAVRRCLDDGADQARGIRRSWVATGGCGQHPGYGRIDQC